MHRVLMVFLDGVGIGEPDPAKNPFFARGSKTFQEIFGRMPTLDQPLLHQGQHHVFPVDALMNVDGYPQSGTGQSSIYCGVNASQITGFHFGPYPHSTLLPVIDEKNIFTWYRQRGLNAEFANAYPRAYFEYLKTHKRRLSVTTISYLSAGYPLNTSTPVYHGRALTAEITNRRWNEKLNYRLPVIRPETAARRLLRIASRNHFTLYEYFMTDYIGHGRYPEEAQEVHENVDRLLYTLFTEHPDTMTVVVVSDHGNYEDISVKTHTFNPALGMASGKFAGRIAGSVRSLPDIKKAVVSITESS